MEPPTPDADALRSTLESLLSVENLQVDSYLRGHLTSQLYVPLAVLARCDRVVALGAAPPAIAEAARASTALRLDPSGTMAKPDVADKRNTLLLRDVPPEAQADEVRALFDAEGCPAPAELRAEAGGSWVVRFAEEEQCLDAVGVLRGRTPPHLFRGELAVGEGEEGEGGGAVGRSRDVGRGQRLPRRPADGAEGERVGRARFVDDTLGNRGAPAAADPPPGAPACGCGRVEQVLRSRDHAGELRPRAGPRCGGDGR